MPKRKQGEVDNQGAQDFELIELLIRGSVKAGPSTSAKKGSDFESFQARFQSYVDQVPSYLHSVGKEGFFPHFFLGSFSTVIDTEIATKLDIEKIYFSFDGAKTLKVAVIKKGEIKTLKDATDKVKLFVIADSSSTKKKFSYGELDKILGDTQVIRNNLVRMARDQDKLGVKLVEITKEKDTKGKTAGISIEVKSDNLDQDTSTAHEFKEIKKGLWNNPESDIAELTNSDKKEVKKSLNKVLKKIGEVHSGYRGEFKEERFVIRDGSLVYVEGAREAAHHGFVAGALVNFRYRYNLRVYLEQFAGRGYADIVLVPRGKDRSLNAIPIIIEMKAATKAELKEVKIGEKSGTTPTAALKQAEDYTKGFQPNVMRVLTTANDMLCVGVNLDHPSPVSNIVAKSRDQEITPLFDEVLVSINEHNNRKIDKGELKERIQNNIERIYHTFPGTGEKGDNHYFSRFLLGQSLLLNEVKVLNSNFEKHVFIYGENIPTEAQPEPKSQRLKDQKSKGQGAGQPSNLDQSHGVVTMVFIPINVQKSVCVMNIVETDGRDNAMNKGIPLDRLQQEIGERKIVELNLNFNIKKKSKFKEYFSVEVGESVSLEQYNIRETNKFEGNFKGIPYPNELKETFDEVLKSQHIDQSASEVSDPEKLKETLNKALDKYKELWGKVGEGVSPFESLIEKEAHFQAVLHGLFSHYSDIKLGDSPENRALVLTEFQTGKGKRVDMLVHGVKFADRGSNAKEYIPVGLELKGPRGDVKIGALKTEANNQISTEYEKGVTYKTLTDGKEVAFMGVVFDKKAKDASSLILMSKDEFTPVKVVHSSIHMIHPNTVAQPIDRPKGKPLGSVEEVIHEIEYSSIQEDRRTLESATAEKNYRYWLQQHDIADIARVEYGYTTDGTDTLFEIVQSPNNISSQLQQFQNSVRDGEQRPLTLIVNLNNNHWVTLVVSHQDGQYSGYYADSLGNNVPDDIRQVLQQDRITNLNDVSILQQTDGHNCGLWALENARDINAVLQGSRSNIPNEIHNHLQVQRDENHFISSRRELSERLSVDQERRANVQNIRAEAERNFNQSPSKCLSRERQRRNIGMPCTDSFDEEKITKEEKEKLIKELFGIEAHDTKIITIDSPQVRVDNDKVNIEFKNNNGNNKKLVIDNATSIKSIENYILDKENLEIKLKVSSDKEYAIIEEVKGQDSEYYLKIDDYRIKLDSILEGGKGVIFDKLHQLSNDKQVLENKKYIEDIGDVQTNQDYNNIVEEIKQNLLAKGVREDTFNRFKSHFDDLGEKVFADYISNVEKNLNEKGITFDRDKFDSAKIKGSKGGKFFSLMAIYDLLDSIGDTATLGRHDNDALKQVFGINGILDAMDDVRESISTHYISSNGRIVTKIPRDRVIGKVVSKIPDSIRKDFVKIINNPVVQSITFATIAYQLGYSVSEIAQGNHHPLNYYWTASSSVKLASMSISPISTGVSFTVKSVSATTKILRGLSAAGKVLGRMSAFTMVTDILVIMGVKFDERIEYIKAIAEQVPLLPGGEQAEVFFAAVIKFFTVRDVEKEYEDTIRIKGYLNYVKEVATKLLNDDYNIAAVVQYVISIEGEYSEIIRDASGECPTFLGAYALFCDHMCELEKKYGNTSFGKIEETSNIKINLSFLNITKALPMQSYTLVMSKDWEKFVCDVSGIVQDSSQCYQDIGSKEVYVVNTDAKHVPHLTKYEYENLGLRIVDAPLKKPIRKSQCSKEINIMGGGFSSCNTNKIHKECQETFTLSGEPFIFTNPKRKSPGNTKKQTFPKGSVLYLSGPRTLTAAANNPAVMHIPQGSNIHYIGSKNNETIFVINNSTSGILEGGVGKENTVVMNVIADNIIADLHDGMLSYGNSNNIRLVNTYNYVSNSDNLQSITTNCKTTLINVKNAEVWQNSLNCTDKDYEFRVVNKENVHHRGLKRTIFVVNEDSDKAKIVSDLGGTEKIKENIDIIRVEVDDITKWRISEDINKIDYNLDFLSNDTQSIVSSTRIDNFRNLIVQVNCSGIVESVTIQDKSLSDTIEDIRYQKLRNSGNDISSEVIQNSEKKLKAFIQVSILDQELLDTYQIAKDIVNNNNFDIPIYQVEVIKNHMGIPTEKVIIAGMYSDQVVVDFGYNNSDVASNYQKYRNNGGSYSYDDYMVLCNYYQDITVEGEKTHHRYVIKLPDTLNSEISSSPIRLNLKIKNKALPMPYSIIDFAKLNVVDVNSIVIKKGERSYINECYNKSISDLTEDSLEIQDITIFDSKGTKWSLSIGLVDYLPSPEHRQIVLQINNQLYKIDSTNLELKHNPNSFRYYSPEEQGLQIYHNQPIDKNDVGLVDFRDKSILDFDTKITDDSLVLSHKNNTLAKVENWNTYQPAREMMLAFNDTMVSNLKCIVSACNSEDIIEDFNKEKVTLLKEKMFDAIVRNNINEAKGLIRKIESVNTESKHELTPLYMAIQGGRLDVVKVLFDRKDFSVENKDTYPLHLAAQEGKLNIAKFLVDKGADIRAKDKDGRTPLRMAAYNGDLEMVKFSLDKNASIENNDPYKMMKMVDVVKKEIINQADTAANVKKWAEFFVEKLRYSIKNVAQEKLKDDMLHDRYSSFNNLADEIYRSDGKLFDDIIKGVINDVYGKVDTKKILSFVQSDGYIDQLISVYIAVFDAMQENDDLNNGAVFKLAYYIKETMNFDNYANARLEKRSNLEELKSRLPESVKNIVFASEVCIKNTYQNEYLYAAVDCFNYDTERRRAFAWVPRKNDKQGVWKIQRYGDSFGIVNVEFNEHLYAASNYFNYDNDRRMVFTWIPGGRVTQGVWKIEPNGNECNIRNVEHNEYLYAADDAKYDKNRRSVFTWIPGGKVTQGVWKIEDCGSSIRKGRSKVEDTSAVDNTGGAFSFNQSLVEPPICNISVNSHFEESVDVNSTDENGWTLLHLAAWQGQLNDASSLVQKGADINAENIFGRKPIHVAAESNNTNIIEFFLSKGMNVDDTDRYGRTPLYCASWNGHLGVVKYLVEKGADVYTQDKGGKTLLDIATDQKHNNIVEYLKQVQLDKELLIAAQYGNLSKVEDLVSQRASLSAKYSDGRTLMHCAAYGGNLDIVKYFVTSKENSLEIKDNGGRVPLHYAAYSGNLSIVKYFVDERKVDVNIKDNNRQTSLHLASWNGHLGVVEYLVGKGANINAKDKDGKTPLHLAAQGNSTNIIQLLLDMKVSSTSVDVEDDAQRTPLYCAAESGNLNAVNLFLDRGANINNRNTISGETLLHAAVKSNKPKVIKIFLDRGISIESKDIFDTTPMLLAARLGKLDAVKFLLENGANIEAQDRNGWTSILHTAEKSKWDVVELLINKGAKFNNETTFQGTPLHFAVQEGNLDMVRFLLDQGADIESQNAYNEKPLHLAVKVGRLDILKLLLDRGANINATDMNGLTPLHLATKFRQGLEVVKHLIEEGADVNVKHRGGMTPLHLAAKHRRLEVVKHLIEEGADVNVKRRGGMTPLHLAAKHRRLEVVKYLIEKGADVNVRRIDGMTPLHLAAKNGELEVVKYLIEKGANINAKDKDEKTPSDLATQKGYNNIVEILRQAQLNLDKELLIAAKKGDLEKVRESIRRGANVNVQDRRGWTPLFWAIQENNFNIIELLLDNSADIKVKDSEGWTPLHWAVSLGSLDIVEHLVERGADVNASTADGRIPLDIARDKGYNNVVNYLEEELNKERKKPAQRKRRHHHGDHARHHMSRKPLAIDSSNQPEIATSSAIKPSSWINGLLGWVKSSVSGLVSSVVNKISTKELENSKSGDTDACSAGLEKMYNATIPQSRKSLVVTKGNIPNRSWSSNQEKVRSNVTVVPEINIAVVDSALILGDLAVRFMHGTRYEQPIHENLLSPREQSMRSIDEGIIIRAIQQGKEKFGVPSTNMDEVEIIGNKTEIGK